MQVGGFVLERSDLRAAAPLEERRRWWQRAASLSVDGDHDRRVVCELRRRLLGAELQLHEDVHLRRRHIQRDDRGQHVVDMLDRRRDVHAWSNCTGCAGVPAEIAPVGSHPNVAGRWGHLEVAGNVAEWTLDSSGDKDNIQLPTPCNDCALLVSWEPRGPGKRRQRRHVHDHAERLMEHAQHEHSAA